MEYYFNPPKNPNASIFKWVKKMEKRSDCIHIHVDYRDVPEKWLGKKLIQSAMEMKKSMKECTIGFGWGYQSDWMKSFITCLIKINMFWIEILPMMKSTELQELMHLVIMAK